MNEEGIYVHGKKIRDLTELDRLRLDSLWLNDEIKELKSRINKVSEYIKKYDLTNNCNFMDDGVGDMFNKLLNILQGSEEN